MSSEFHSCPRCDGDAEHRKTVVLKDGETVKKVWLCRACMIMFVTVSTLKERKDVV